MAHPALGDLVAAPDDDLLDRHAGPGGAAQHFGLEAVASGEAAHRLDHGERIDSEPALAVGDPRAGTSYTLTSVTAVVLGGASIFGGRGSFVGALFGALLIQEIVTSTAFLQIGIEWQYYLPGLLILLGAGIYSRARRIGALSLDAAV